MACALDPSPGWRSSSGQCSTSCTATVQHAGCLIDGSYLKHVDVQWQLLDPAPAIAAGLHTLVATGTALALESSRRGRE